MKYLNANFDPNPRFTDSSGPWLYRSDGTRVFDCWLGSGTLIFGHKSPSYAPENLSQMLPHGIKVTDDQLLHLNNCVSYPIQGIGLQTSGSAAITRAIRIARAYKNRMLIATIANFWHGSEDITLFREDHLPLSTGIDEQSQVNVKHFSSLREFLKSENVNEFAAILVEPYQGSNPSESVLDSLDSDSRQQLRQSGVLLIFDEIITGFRERYGSCSTARKLEADITVFGKAIGGGYPIGAVFCGEFLNEIKERYPFWGGTFAASPPQVRALFRSLQLLRELNYDELKRNHECLLSAISNSVDHDFIEILSGCNFSRLAVKGKGRQSRGFLNTDEIFSKNRILLEENGIFVGSNGLIFPSTFNINDVRG